MADLNWIHPNPLNSNQHETTPQKRERYAILFFPIRKHVDYLSVCDNELSCICKIGPVIDKDFLKFLNDLSGFDNVRFLKFHKT